MSSTDVRNLAGDLLGAKLGVARLDLVLLDVDRGEKVVFHDPLGQDDGVLVVVAFPRHERHEEVLAEGELARLGRGAVRQHRADRDFLAWRDDGVMVDAGALVGALELGQDVRIRPRTLRRPNDDLPGVHELDDAALLRNDDLAGVDSRTTLHTGTDERCRGTQERNSLALHVGSHESAVGVVVLQERDERGGHRDHLTRRHVHELDALRLDLGGLSALEAAQNRVADEGARLCIEQLVRLRDDVPLFDVRGEVLDIVGDLALDDLAIRRPS